MKFTFKFNGFEAVRNTNNAEAIKIKLDEIGFTYEYCTHRN